MRPRPLAIIDTINDACVRGRMLPYSRPVRISSDCSHLNKQIHPRLTAVRILCTDSVKNPNRENNPFPLNNPRVQKQCNICGILRCEFAFDPGDLSLFQQEDTLLKTIEL